MTHGDSSAQLVIIVLKKKSTNPQDLVHQVHTETRPVVSSLITVGIALPDFIASKEHLSLFLVSQVSIVQEEHLHQLLVSQAIIATHRARNQRFVHQVTTAQGTALTFM
jgi:hypothetical protein